jgi:hypothetical protein
MWMSSTQLRLRWDGPALDDHLIDVQEFAPSLLALGDLIVDANKSLNGDKASVRVAVSAGVEQNCFEIDVHLFFDVMSSVRGMLIKDEVATIKDILEWLDILVPGGASVGVLMLLRHLAGKKVRDEKVIVSADGKNTVRLTIEGDNNHVEIHDVGQKVWQLTKDQSIRDDAAKFLAPLAREGFESVTFEDGNDPSRRRTISKADGSSIAFDPPLIEAETAEVNAQETTLWAKVYSPVYDPAQPRWRFDLGDGPKYVDISDTDIARDAIGRGGAAVNDVYQLRVRVTQSLTGSGKLSSSYKALEVLQFVPANLPLRQSGLFDDEPEEGPAE